MGRPLTAKPLFLFLILFVEGLNPDPVKSSFAAGRREREGRSPGPGVRDPRDRGDIRRRQGEQE